MFNFDNRVRLEEFASFGKLVRGGEFFAVGKIPSRAPARLVPVSTANHLKDAVSRMPDVAGIICSPDLAASIPDDIPCLASENPQLAAHEIHTLLAERSGYYWTDFATRIAPDARIHPKAIIAERNVEIGSGTVIDCGAIILERSIIGGDCQIGPGTIIGTGAFELIAKDGRNQLLTQVGGVRIGSRSIFLSGTMVARSAFPAFTEIGENCAFDNLVHVAHDCVIGAGSQVTAGAILAGRVTLADNCFIGPNATVSNGLSLGEGSSVSIGSTVVHDVEAGQKVTGYFATEHRAFLRSLSPKGR